MEKDLKYAALLDLYGGLLTKKQAEAMDYYYNSDYSLGEISELMDITRQGARDFIKRGETVIREAEARLGLGARLQRLDRIRKNAESILQSGAGPEVNVFAERIIKETELIRNGEL